MLIAMTLEFIAMTLELIACGSRASDSISEGVNYFDVFSLLESESMISSNYEEQDSSIELLLFYIRD